MTKRYRNGEIWDFEHETAVARTRGVILGLDGGTTSTVCVAMPFIPFADPLPDPLPVLARAVAGCSNHNSVGETAARETLEQVMADALSKSGSSRSAVRAVCLAVSGVNHPTDQQRILGWLREIFPSHVKLFGSPLLRRRAGLLHSRESFRTLVDLAAIKWVRDRGLDHAVEKERNLSPLLNLKNLVKSEPSKSLPLSIIATNSQALDLPIRPIDFVRKYPSVFEEFLPGGIRIHPHVKLTPETLGLDAEEQLIYQSEIHKQDSADRLLKLLMLTGIRKIPLPLIHRLQRDLGLPQDYAKTIVPEAPDYFRITGGSDPSLELVCWSSELAVSAMEKKATEGKLIEFRLQYSRGFEMDKKFKKWVDQWQKLPYISPYENALHLPAKTDEADKWAVAVLHEFLHLLVSKKTERENVLCFGECLGLRSRFKRALLQHPGIFYLSSKIGTHTVVLRDGYKRDLLIEKHPLMDMRHKYIHLMNTMKEGKKRQNVQGGSAQGKPSEDQVDKSEDEQDEELYGLSGSDVEHASDDEEEDEYESRSVRSRNAEGNRARIRRNSKYVAERSLKTSLATNFDRRYPSSRTRRTDPVEVSRRTVMRSETPKFSRTRGRSKTST